MFSELLESVDTTSAVNDPPAAKEMRPPSHRSGSVTLPWYDSELDCAPVGNQSDPSFSGIAYRPAAIGTVTTAVAGSHSATHETVKDTLALSTDTLAAGCDPGIVMQ